MKNMFRAKLSLIVIVAVVGSILMSSAQCWADEAFDLDAYKKKIKKWQDLKYGLFVHWGPCSVAGVEIGWGRNAPRSGNPNSWYPPKEMMIDGDEYDNLYKKFDPVDFDADEWMKIIKKAGMKYIVLTAKHVDGFMLWDTKTSDYNIMNSAYGKDICKEIADAAHKHGIKLGWYYAPCDWYDPDCRHPERHGVYIKRMQEQLRELMSNYGKVDILWIDTDGGSGQWDQDNTYAIVRKLQPEIVINNRLDYSRLHNGSVYAGWAESYWKRIQGQPARWKDFGDYNAAAENHIGGYSTVPHESCMSMLHGQWAWKPGIKLYSGTDGSNFLVHSLLGNGNFLYNVGPMPTGEIEDRQQKNLLDTGKWLKKVGQAFYETTAGPILPGNWGGSTTKGKNVYLFMPDHNVNNWDHEKAYPLVALDKKLVRAKSLTGEKVTARQKSDGSIEINMPNAAGKRPDGYADYMIVKLTFDEDNPQIKASATSLQDNMVKQSNIRPGSNIAFVGTVTMEPGYAWGGLPHHAVDGNSETLSQSASPVWDMTIDLHKVYPIDKIKILPTAGVWANEYSIKVSTDNKNWTTIDTATNAQDQLRTIEFDKIDVRYVWMDVTGVGHTGNWGHSIREFEIYMAK